MPARPHASGTGFGSIESVGMLSAILMFRRVARAWQYAVREDDFLNVFGAGFVLVVIGTLVYTLDESWNPVDALYFAVSTLTTTSVSDPGLVLTDGWVKRYTVLYQILGIGILVEILRRLGTAFVVARAEEKAAKQAPE
jgi:Trk-type K+ transport system membrane component